MKTKRARERRKRQRRMERRRARRKRRRLTRKRKKIWRGAGDVDKDDLVGNDARPKGHRKAEGKGARHSEPRMQ
eukprot:2719153-Pyramimonas_sp.AAC.1